MARKKTTRPTPVGAIRHHDTRVNIPTEELRDFVARDETVPKTMIYPRDPTLDPQLVWRGKDDQDRASLAVPVVPIYIQEKIHPQALIENLRARRERMTSPVGVIERSPALRPPLKWAGGKRWQLPLLGPIWQAHRHRRLVEPFCGGLAVAMGLRPDVAVLNDVNPHLINFYRHVRRGLVVDVEFRNSARAYYRCRTRFNRLLRNGGARSREAAALFYYLNRTGYNGLCRFNRSGGFNVPFGRYRRIAYRTDFREYREVFAHFTFRNVDFGRLKLEPGDFVYADPPYDVPFTQYSRGGFSWAEQERTARWLAQHPGPVVLVNQATPRIVDLYTGLGYTLMEHAAPRMISCTGNRAPAREVLATRNV